MTETTSPAVTTRPLEDAAIDQLFDRAHTTNTFTGEPVDLALVRAAYEHLRWAPTAMNGQPLRLTVLASAEGRARVAAHLAEGNQAKTLAAPLTIVAAYDPRFHEHLPVLAPFRTGAREQLEPRAEAREAMARTNALIQFGYLLLALRAMGLQVGPMGGLDPAGVDTEVHAESGWKTLFVVNVGHAPNPGDPQAQHPRAGRLEFDQASQVR
ncbi:MAG: malonic semialdehyde reductase [Georgenia sp.]